MVDRFREFVITRGLWRSIRAGLLAVSMIVALADRASAQEIEPYDFVPLPAGTNLAIGYYVYGHDTEFSVARGPTIKNSGLEANLGIGRYVHLIDLAGHPAGFQLVQIFGSLSGAHVDGERLGSAFGAQNVGLSAFIWPYVNTATKTNFNTTFWLYPPSGTYDKRSPINVGDNRWRGNVQLGLSQGIDEHFGFDLDVDVMFYGDNNSYVPGNNRLSQDPTWRTQLWANYRWSAAFTTSIGYEGFFGGSQKTNGFLNGNRSEEQRIRFNAALFVTPTTQTMLELNRDLEVSGGFKQDFGATLRVVHAF